MNISSSVKILWHFLKLLSWKETKDMSRADKSVNHWRNSPISNQKPDLHNSNAHAKFGENPLKFTQDIVQKQNYWHVVGR